MTNRKIHYKSEGKLDNTLELASYVIKILVQVNIERYDLCSNYHATHTTKNFFKRLPVCHMIFLTNFLT